MTFCRRWGVPRFSALFMMAQKRGGRRRGRAGSGGRRRDTAAGMVGSARGGHTEAAGAIFRCKRMRVPQCDCQSQGRRDVSVCPAFLSLAATFLGSQPDSAQGAIKFRQTGSRSPLFSPDALRLGSRLPERTTDAPDKQDSCWNDMPRLQHMLQNIEHI